MLNVPMCSRHFFRKVLNLTILKQIFHVLAFRLRYPVPVIWNSKGLFSNPSTWAWISTNKITIWAKYKSGRITKSNGSGMYQLRQGDEFSYLAVCVPC